MEHNTPNTALLVMDMQTSILSSLPDNTKIINNVTNAIAAARAKGLPVIYVVVGFRPGAPEISANNKRFSTFKDKFTAEAAEQWLQIHPQVAPQANDIIVTKRRVSAFAGSDLEIVLRGQNIQHMVLTGVSTSGVVLSTLREAADKDFQITVLSDCCADRDDEVHNVLLTKVFPNQADVMTVEEWKK